MPRHKRKRRSKRERATSNALEPDSASPPNVLECIIGGGPVAGVLPTLGERVKAAIAVAPYFAPKFRHMESTEWVAGAAGGIDVTQLSDRQIDARLRMLQAMRAADEAGKDAIAQPSLRRPDPARIRTGGPNIFPNDLDERPHEFLARVARGEPIDGYLPPLKLRRIAAVAAAPYYAAILRSVEFMEEPVEVEPFTDEEIERRLAELERERAREGTSCTSRQ